MQIEEGTDLVDYIGINEVWGSLNRLDFHLIAPERKIAQKRKAREGQQNALKTRCKATGMREAEIATGTKLGSKHSESEAWIQYYRFDCLQLAMITYF
jgi:hypothetical protein